MADRRERALDRVRCSQVLPVFGGEVVEGEQRVAVFGQAIGRLFEFQRVALDEGVERGLSGGLGLGHPDLLQRTLGLWLLALRQLGEHVRGFVHPAPLRGSLRPHFTGGPPESERAVGDHQLGRAVEPSALEIEQKIAPIMRAFPCAIGESDEFLATLRRRTDDDENALLLIFEPGFQMDAVGPNVDVAPRRKITLLPCGILL